MVVTETQQAQRDSRRLVGRGVRLAGEGHRRAVGRDRRESTGRRRGRRRSIVRSPVATSMRTRRAADRRAGRGHLPRRHDEAAVGADVEVALAQRAPRGAGSGRGCGPSTSEQMRAGRARGRGPSTEPGSRCAGPPMTLLSLRSVPQPPVVVDVSAPTAAAVAATTVTAAARAVRTAVDAAGQRQRLDRLAARRGQPPQRRGRLVVVVASDATATNSRSPSAVNAGDDSPLAPRVSRRAGRWPAGSSSQIALTNSVRLSLSSATVVTTRDPSGRHRQAGHPRQREVVVEVVEGRRRGRHALLVAHRAIGSSKFDFQTHCCHAGRMSTVVLAELPGRAVPDRGIARAGRRAVVAADRPRAGAGQPSVLRHRRADRSAARPSSGAAQGARRGRAWSAATAYQSAPPRFEYHLTESGRDLIPVLDALTAWGLDHAVEPGRP